MTDFNNLSRNKLQKQVEDLTNITESLLDTHFIEGGFNMTAAIKYAESSLTALQAHTATNEPLGTFGTVGDVLYVVAKTGDAEQAWKELGKFPAVGPQGPQGPAGAQGVQGPKGEEGLSYLALQEALPVTMTPVVGTKLTITPLQRFNRTPVVGDLIYIDTYTGTLGESDFHDLCYCIVSEVSSNTATCVVASVTRTTGENGQDGKDGRGLEGVTSFSFRDANIVSYNTSTGATFIGKSRFSDKDGVISMQTGTVILPIKGGNGITVDAASGNNAIEVKAADTITLTDNQSYNINYNADPIIGFQDGKIEIGGCDGSAWFTINGVSGDTYRSSIPHVVGHPYISDSGEITVWQLTDSYYEITGVPVSATSGTLPSDDGWDYIYYAKPGIRIMFNKELYTLNDNQHTKGTLVFSHVGYENQQLIVKTITITLATKAWKLTTIKVPTVAYQALIELLGNDYTTKPIIGINGMSSQEILNNYNYSSNNIIDGIFVYEGQTYYIDTVDFNWIDDFNTNGGTVGCTKLSDGTHTTLNFTNTQLRISDFGQSPIPGVVS